ncbi:MAG TPA: phosphonatase-like hydrolase [Gammaproteobacteria bacterium]|jgi:phosphonatase-like hydrolase|nr:phosphonatase-like hydrolase [Gammaproteobacteria bacterium]
MNDIRLVVFDMAGTTIEDAGQVPEAFTTVLHEHGIEITPEALQPVRGASKRDAIRHFVEQDGGAAADIDARTDEIFAAFRKRLTDIFARDGVRWIPGATDTFKWLHDHHVKVVLNTGFDRAVTDVIVDAVGGNDVADAIVCGDDVSLGRPAPYMIFRAMERTGVIGVRQVVNVGDTVLDLEAGNNAGAQGVVGVLSGAHSREQLERRPHTHLLASVADLPRILMD